MVVLGLGLELRSRLGTKLGSRLGLGFGFGFGFGLGSGSGSGSGLGCGLGLRHVDSEDHAGDDHDEHAAQQLAVLEGREG